MNIGKSEPEGMMIPGFVGIFSEKECAEIVAPAWRIYMKGDSPLAAKIKDSIRTHIKIRGISDINKANPGQIRRELEIQWMDYEDLCDLVLECWVSQNQELKKICATWIEEHNKIEVLGIIKELAKTVQNDENEIPGPLEYAIKEIVRQNPKFRYLTDVRVMIELLLRQKTKEFKPEEEPAEEPAQAEEIQNERSEILPEEILTEEKPSQPEEFQVEHHDFQPEEIPEDEKPAQLEEIQNEHHDTQPEAWETILDILRRIPADDPHWNSIETLIDSIQQIVQIKRQEIFIEQLSTDLLKALENNADQRDRYVKYLRIELSGPWLAENVVEGKVEVVINGLKQLDKHLQEHKELREKLRDLLLKDLIDSSPEERSQIEEEISKYDREMKLEFHALDILFVPPVLDSLGASAENKSIDKAEFDKPLINTEIQAETIPTIAKQEPGVDIPSQEETEHRDVEQDSDEDKYEEGSSGVETADEELPQIGQSVEESLGEKDQAESSVEEVKPIVDNGASPLPIEVKEPELFLLEKDDLSEAYWLAWALEQQNKPTLIPSWLISAIQGAEWNIALWPEQHQNLVESICEFVRPGDRVFGQEEGCAWMGLAAGLFFSLVDPGNGWEEWLDIPIPSKTTYFSELVQLIRMANHKGLRLNPVQVQMVVNSEMVEQQIKQYAQKARLWIQQSRTRNARTGGATQVWQALVDPSKGELFHLIEPVAGDERSKASEISRQLADWRNRDWLDRHIQKLDKSLKQRRGFMIVGEERAQIIGWILDICETAANWSEANQQNYEISQGGNWQLIQMKEFCDSCKNLLPNTKAEIEGYQTSSNDSVSSVALKKIIRILTGLEGILTPGFASSIKDRSRPPYFVVNHPTHALPTMRDHLSFGLLNYPEMELGDDGYPEESQAENVVAVLLKNESRSIEDSLNGWISSRDYRFISTILSQVNNREIWESRIREAFRMDLQRFEQKDIEDTVIAVEQAMLESLIPESEYTAYRSRVESFRKNIRQVDIETFGQISPRKMSARLGEIRKELSLKREERLANHKKHWHNLKSQLPQIIDDEPGLLETIEAVVEKSLLEQDLRITGEYLAHLDAVMANVKPLDRSIFGEKPATDNEAILDFQNLIPGLVNLLDEARSHLSLGQIRDRILNEQPLPGFQIPHLPKGRLEEAAQALDTWRRLKGQGLNNPQANLLNVAILMRYLGFSLPENGAVSLKENPGGLPTFHHWRVATYRHDYSPVAQFGSLRSGHNDVSYYYDVIGVWERPGLDVISSQVNTIMQQTGNEPTILFYFGRLLPSQRDDLLNVTHKNGLPMLVVDETLILYLVQEYGSRLLPMLLCTLPYAALNPYFPSIAGLVPPEVYKGRQELVNKVIDPLGTVIIYGGRQLGKSALLRQVERKFNNKENGKFAIYDDIKSVGDPASGKDYKTDLRDRMVHAFLHLGLLKPQQGMIDLDHLFLWIQQQVNEKNLRLLLLLDEADHFLDADATKNFVIVQAFERLMGQTNRNFKLVLAGLHNVQRFQRIPNQPLAHFAAEEIGPLDPGPALDLLLQPLHALGYRFGQGPDKEDTSLALHILSYTNYHPGLIQLFGKYLVEHIQQKPQHSAKLPFSITRADIEAVYRKKEVRDAICERFNWTLALDPRYEAITLALILEQWDDQNGFDKLYSSTRLKEISQYQWTEAFSSDISPDQFKGFLEEMRGLGVLSVSQDGNSYRLRSPNLVYLMGNRDQVLDRMAVLSRSTPPGEQALESYHAHMEEGPYSPLTFAQERVLNNSRSGVAIIIGSNATGLRNLDMALQRLVPRNTGALIEIGIVSRSAEAIQRQLNQFVHDKPKANYLVALRELEGDPEDLFAQVSGALRACNQVHGRTLRVLFTMGPQAAWQWFQLNSKERESIEDQVDTVVRLRRWDRLGLKHRLEMEPWNGNEIITSDRLMNKVYDIVGGWPFLFDEMVEKCPESDLNVALDSFRQMVSNHKSDVSRSFISSLGITDELPLTVIRALLREDLREMIEKGENEIDVLTLAIDGKTPQEIDNAVEYLKRMSVVNAEPFLTVEPVFGRIWNAS